MWQPALSQADVEILESQIAYNGVYQIVKHQLRHRYFDGQWSPVLNREQIHRRPAVAAVLYDVKQDAVVMVEQLRIGPLGQAQSPWMLELVAGLIDKDESPEATIKREIMEEAGCEATMVYQIAQCHNTPGGFAEQTSIFYAPVEAPDNGALRGLADEHEDIKVHVIPRTEALALLAQGAITSASSVIGLQWLALNYEALPNQDPT